MGNENKKNNMWVKGLVGDSIEKSFTKIRPSTPKPDYKPPASNPVPKGNGGGNGK